MIAQITAPIPTIENSAPAGSTARAGPRDSGISAIDPMIAATAIGTLIRKIEPHQKCSSRTPPIVGPATTPTIATVDHAAIALRCSSGGNTVNSNDNVLGISSEPPTPISPRQAINCQGVVASVASSDARPNSTSPIRSIRRRPNRSDRLPAVSSRPANARM